MQGTELYAANLVPVTDHYELKVPGPRYADSDITALEALMATGAPTP